MPNYYLFFSANLEYFENATKYTYDIFPIFLQNKIDPGQSVEDPGQFLQDTGQSV